MSKLSKLYFLIFVLNRNSTKLCGFKNEGVTKLSYLSLIFSFDQKISLNTFSYCHRIFFVIYFLRALMDSGGSENKDHNSQQKLYKDNPWRSWILEFITFCGCLKDWTVCIKQVVMLQLSRKTTKLVWTLPTRLLFQGKLDPRFYLPSNKAKCFNFSYNFFLWFKYGLG